MTKVKLDKISFNGRREKIPPDHVEVVNITTDGDKILSVNFNTGFIERAEQRHLDIMLVALNEAFYRLRPDLRPQ